MVMILFPFVNLQFAVLGFQRVKEKETVQYVPSFVQNEKAHQGFFSQLKISISHHILLHGNKLS